MSNKSNLNDARSEAMRQRLIGATSELLVEVGYAQTTGVAVCKRAGVTRGALGHHFPDFVDLLIATLREIYRRMIDAGTPEDASRGALENRLLADYHRVIQPEYKAVIELWLASRNDTVAGAALSQAIVEASELFSPRARLLRPEQGSSLEKNLLHANPQTDAVYYTLMEALIGIGLGRATNGGAESAHEHQVLQTLIGIARQQDSLNQADSQGSPHD